MLVVLKLLLRSIINSKILCLIIIDNLLNYGKPLNSYMRKNFCTIINFIQSPFSENVNSEIKEC